MRTPFGRDGGALPTVRADGLGAVPIAAPMARKPSVGHPVSDGPGVRRRPARARALPGVLAVDWTASGTAAGRRAVMPSPAVIDTRRDARDRASLDPVKSLRLLVLVLLAMLLPLRGVSAAALLCEQQPASHSEAVGHDHGDHDMASAAGEDRVQHDHSHNGFDKRHLCLSSCAAAPLMGAVPAVLTPPLAGTTVFPHFAAPVPTFQSDGQDRPPRSS